MFEDVIYSNEFIELIEEENSYYLKVLKKGLTMPELNKLLLDFPRVRVLKFNSIKEALSSNSNKMVKIGDKKPLVDVFVSKDKLEASVFINMTEKEFEAIEKKALVEKVLLAMRDNGVIFGFNINEIMDNLEPMKKIVVAKGILPKKGDDAIITLYEIEDAKPQVYNNGNVNHYELNLINKVEAGDWVGERIEPKEGVPGKNVCGEIIPALKGNQEKLKYDRKSIKEEYNEKEDKTILFSKRTGAVVFENDLLSVCNYLEIKGKVSFETGNIDFDGFVDVKDSIEDNFTVKADHDIQILGDMGVGGVEEIESREGSVYIRGGIAGKGKAKVVCTGDLYTKFAADCTIECGGSVHIGYYAMNCNITAKEVILDSFNSKIIGGNTKAQVRIVASELGNKMEIPTHIEIEGFNRNKVKEEYDFINETIEKVKIKIKELKQKIAIYSIGASIDEEKKIQYEKYSEEYEYFTKNLKMLYEKQKKCISYLQAKGEGEVKVSKCIYPKVHLKIKNNDIWNVNVSKSPVTYYTDGTDIITA